MKNIRHLISAILAVLVISITSTLAHSQGKPSLLVLGSAHFASSGRDNINFEVEDVLSDRRQDEMKQLVQQLAAYNPTHIAIEIPSLYQANVDKRYDDYRAGDYELTRNEADQIGLRLAAMLGHDRIYAVDWNANPPGDVETDYNWVTYGQTHGQEDAVSAIIDPASAKSFYFELEDQSISQWLKQLNAPAALHASHQSYLKIAQIGQGEELIGANWVGTWYARNLKIYSRLVSLAAGSDARVLVIYGQAHAYLLQQFAREQGVFNLVSAEKVLAD